MKRKLLISLGAVVALTPVVAVVACGHSAKEEKPLTKEEKISKVFESMSPLEKSIIFENVDKTTGAIEYRQGNYQFVSNGQTITITEHDVKIHNINDLINEINLFDGKYNNMGIGTYHDAQGNLVVGTPIIKESTLFDIFFVSADLYKNGNEQLSDEKINNVISMFNTYFAGPDGKGGDTARFATLWGYIRNENYDWLKMFFKYA